MLKNSLRIVSVAGAALFAVASLTYLNTSVAATSAAFAEDYLVVSQNALTPAQTTAVADAETLHDWQFTGRDRPPKCRVGR